MKPSRDEEDEHSLGYYQRVSFVTKGPANNVWIQSEKNKQNALPLPKQSAFAFSPSAWKVNLEVVASTLVLWARDISDETPEILVISPTSWYSVMTTYNVD